MPNYTSITILNHAKDRMALRNVTEADATSTICDPDIKTKQHVGKNGGMVYLFSKPIGDARLFVAAEIVAKDAYIVTVYWENDEEP
jgi:Domain of unknown function (DUF4258)